MAPGAVMALSKHDLEEIEAAAERGSTKALENLGLFARDEFGITRWRKNFQWVDAQRQTSEKMGRAIKRYGWIAIITAILLAFKYDALNFISFVVSGGRK